MLRARPPLFRAALILLPLSMALYYAPLHRPFFAGLACLSGFALAIVGRSRWARHAVRDGFSVALLVAWALTGLAADHLTWHLAFLALLALHAAVAYRRHLRPMLPPDAPLPRVLESCVDCGLCVDACEVVAFKPEARFAPLGKIEGFRDLARLNDIALNELRSGVCLCSACGLCARACPAGIDTLSMMVAMKRELVARRRHPPPFHVLRDKTARTGNVYGRPREDRAAWLDFLSEEARSAIDPKAETLFFAGCAALSPVTYDAQDAFLRLCARRGLKVRVLGAEEPCCGGPLREAGFDAPRPELGANVVSNNSLCAKALGAITHVEFLDLRAPEGDALHDHARGSCGAGGALPFLAPDLAVDLAIRFWASHEGGRPIVTTCTSCLKQLVDARETVNRRAAALEQAGIPAEERAERIDVPVLDIAQRVV